MIFVSFLKLHYFHREMWLYVDLQWGKKVFSQPPIVQVIPLKKVREACNQKITL